MHPWVFPTIIGSIGILYLIYNIGAIIETKKIQAKGSDHHISGIPFLGGIHILIAGLISPIKWLALLCVLDYTFWSFLRPYIQIGTAFHTSMDETFSAGGGLDFMFGKLMFNLDYSSTWRYAFDTDIVVSKQSNKNRVRGEWSHYNTFAVGVGVNW